MIQPHTYKVRFEKSVINARFGMLLKTVSGFELGGYASASSPQDGLSFVGVGTVYAVEFRFNCALTSGVYFLNAGVVEDIKGLEGYLHRWWMLSCLA